ncbi:aldo/keto reductase [Schlesneria paludicola]|uniref:aldo/keto reductase n=1 Tax=Schlesneria paludicola TaxID=360056 RepID=UPI00029A8946|nr:aldo/keto reductase [Schlesneria paludicola]
MTTPQRRLLNDGHQLPLIGFGTWPLDDDQATIAVDAALQAGYRLIDTAARYGNEVGVGRGVRDSGIPRQDIVLTTKLRGSAHGYDNTLRGFDTSLKRLGTDYLDLYLIHWPQPTVNLYVESWKAFIRLKEEGLVRSIGVSNFLPEHIDHLQQATGVLPAVNQIELHPNYSQLNLRQWLVQKGILVQSWSPLGQGEELNQSAIQTLARKHDRTTAQIVLRWHLQLGLLPIPKSQNSQRIQQNIAIFDFSLDQDDLAALATLEANHRLGEDPTSFTEE